MRKPEKDYEISTKHMPLKIVLFVLALGIAGASFSIFFLSVTAKSPGYYKVYATSNKDVKSYESLMHLNYYFDGSSDEIKSNTSKVTSLFTSSLLEISTALSEVDTYEKYTSIGEINKRIGEDVIVNELIYNTLKRAYDYSLNYSNYSIFSGVLQGFWIEEGYLSDTERYENDILFNEENKQYFDKLVSFTTAPHVSIEFKENYTVRVNISEEYKTFREQYSITDPVVSLNVLKYPLMLEYVAKDLSNSGYNTGYLETADDYIYALSENKSVVCNFYSEKDNTIMLDGVLTLENNAFVTVRNYFQNSLTDYKYKVVKDGTTYYRNDYINVVDGNPNQNIESLISIYKGTQSIVESALKMNELDAIDTPEHTIERMSGLKNDEMYFIASLNRDENIYVSDLMKSKLQVATSKEQAIVQI